MIGWRTWWFKNWLRCNIIHKVDILLEKPNKPNPNFSRCWLLKLILKKGFLLYLDWSESNLKPQEVLAMISKADIIKYSQSKWKYLKSTTHSRAGTAVERNVLSRLCHCSSQQKKQRAELEGIVSVARTPDAFCLYITLECKYRNFRLQSPNLMRWTYLKILVLWW